MSETQPQELSNEELAGRLEDTMATAHALKSRSELPWIQQHADNIIESAQVLSRKTACLA